MTQTKRWKHKGRPLRIPVQHEPGTQKGLFGGKPKHQPSHTKGSTSNGSVQFWGPTTGTKNLPPSERSERNRAVLYRMRGVTA